MHRRAVLLGGLAAAGAAAAGHASACSLVPRTCATFAARERRVRHRVVARVTDIANHRTIPPDELDGMEADRADFTVEVVKRLKGGPRPGERLSFEGGTGDCNGMLLGYFPDLRAMVVLDLSRDGRGWRVDGYGRFEEYATRAIMCGR